MTPVSEFTDTALAKAGRHSFSWSISNVAPGGIWRVSAIYYAFGRYGLGGP